MPQPTRAGVTAQIDVIKQHTAIKGIQANMTAVTESLETMVYWRPAAILAARGREMVRLIDQINQRLDKKLVVTFIGPSGAGKSTLLNALSGVDELSKTGRHRPTTRQPVVLCENPDDADPLIEKIGTVEIRTHQMADNLAHLILVDTPDTDSNEQAQHIPLVQKAIALSDVLICVFDAQNPKRRDQIDFLNDYVGRFSGDALVVVVNKCDRQSKAELQETIIPQFKKILSAAWEIPVKAVLGVSARRHLNNPQFDETVSPRHEFDQFAVLKQLLSESLNRAGIGAEVRLANAQQIEQEHLQNIDAEIETDLPVMNRAAQAMQTAERHAFDAAITALNDTQRHLNLGANVMLYHELAQRWSGPMGWMIALWARILMFGSGMTALFRPGNPFRNLWGLIKTWRQYKESQEARDEVESGKGSNAALECYRHTLQNRWPDVAELLIKGRFDTKVRDAKMTPPAITAMDDTFSTAWGRALGDTINHSANGLSHWLLQLLFNLPAVAVLCYVGWLTGLAFFARNYLAGDFFIHALMTAGLILLVSFFLYQAIVQLSAGPNRLMRNTFEKVNQATAALQPQLEHPAAREIETLEVIYQGIRQALTE